MARCLSNCACRLHDMLAREGFAEGLQGPVRSPFLPPALETRQSGNSHFAGSGLSDDAQQKGRPTLEECLKGATWVDVNVLCVERRFSCQLAGQVGNCD